MELVVSSTENCAGKHLARVALKANFELRKFLIITIPVPDPEPFQRLPPAHFAAGAALELILSGSETPRAGSSGGPAVRPHRARPPYEGHCFSPATRPMNDSHVHLLWQPPRPLDCPGQIPCTTMSAALRLPNRRCVRLIGLRSYNTGGLKVLRNPLSFSE